MKQLVRNVLGLIVNKKNEGRFSNWNADKHSPAQIKYALIDVIDVDSP
jgi:ribonuclease D